MSKEMVDALVVMRAIHSLWVSHGRWPTAEEFAEFVGVDVTPELRRNHDLLKASYDELEAAIVKRQEIEEMKADQNPGGIAGGVLDGSYDPGGPPSRWPDPGGLHPRRHPQRAPYGPITFDQHVDMAASFGEAASQFSGYWQPM